MMNKILYLLFFFPIALFAAVFTDTIETQDKFLHYSMELDGSRFCKFVVDLETNEIFYINPQEYELHTEFVFAELWKKPLTPLLHREFNKNYGELKPKYLLCTLEHHLQQNIWTFSFWEGDRAGCGYIEKAFTRLNETFYLGNNLLYKTHSNYQEEIAKLLVKIPYVTSDQLYKTSEYQPYTYAKSVGLLRIVTEPDDTLEFAENEIVVLTHVLPDITPVAGIITEQFSTPLSHLALRARAWRIPHIGLKGAIATLKPYNGHYVVFTSDRSGYEIRLASEEERLAHQKTEKPPSTLLLPKANLDPHPIASLREKLITDQTVYGTKAAALGKVAQLAFCPYKVPEGFAIPFYYYAEHLQQSGVSEQLQQLLKQKRVSKSQLEMIRNAILIFPLDKSLLDESYNAMLQLKANGVFVRSSTNAEDLPGFTGAGLYDTVANVKDKDSLELAIKQVWASVWNLKAYEERAKFGNNPHHVFAACLVQEGLLASSAGVLITENIFDEEDAMEVYTINAKRGLGEGVVSGSTVPEQILFNCDNGGIKVLSRSDDPEMVVFADDGGTKVVPNPFYGLPILADEMAYNLARAARFIKYRLGETDSWDIEWLFLDQKLYILQVRPVISFSKSLRLCDFAPLR